MFSTYHTTCEVIKRCVNNSPDVLKYNVQYCTVQDMNTSDRLGDAAVFYSPCYGYIECFQVT